MRSESRLHRHISAITANRLVAASCGFAGVAAAVSFATLPSSALANTPPNSASKAAAHPAASPAASAAAAANRKKAADLVAAARDAIYPSDGRRTDAAGLAAASDQLTAAIAADPHNADAQFLTGVIAERRQDIPGAIAAYTQAATLDKTGPAGVSANLHLDVLRRAATQMQDPAVVTKTRYAALIGQAKTALGSGDTALAISCAGEAATAMPGQWEAPAISGLARFQTSDFKGGLDDLTAAQTAAPDALKPMLKAPIDACSREVHAAEFLSYGDKKSAAKDYAAAAQEYIKAASLFPDRPKYRLEAANACALAKDYHRGLLLVKPLLSSPDPVIARRAAAYDRQFKALVHLDQTAHSVQTTADHQVAQLSNPGADTDKMAKESQEYEDKIAAEAAKRAEKIAELKTELQLALDRYKQYTGDTLAMGDLFSRSQKLSSTATDSSSAKTSSLLGAIAKLAEIENKRKADSTKKEIDELTAEIEGLGGTVEFKTGAD